MAAPLRNKAVYVASCVPNLLTHITRFLPGVTVIDIEKSLFQVTDELKMKIKDAEVLVADPPLIGDLLYTDLNLKLVNSTWAGVNVMMSKLDKTKRKPLFKMTRTGQGFGQIMGEYVIGHIISLERRFKRTFKSQSERVWDKESVATFRPLTSLNIGILGLGQIGNDVAKMCKSLGMTVTGIKRQNSDTPVCKHVDQIGYIEKISEILPSCDYLCSVLPSTPETRDLLSGNVLSHCKKKKTILINIGRGDVINEETIVEAIKNEWIGGAILDVFKTEPLPEFSPLWDLPNVTITPHVSGPSLPEQVAQCFAENYSRFINGEALKYEVNWDKGY